VLVIKSSGARKALKILLPAFAIPATVAAGAVLLEEKQYALISLAVAVMATVLFAAGFEKKQTGTRRLIICAVMIALSVAGRFIPLFKPVTALTVITAVYLGGESGFLVGAMSALISNFYFGQGPWTPFQMLAWGFIGLFAGISGRYLKKSRISMAAYGLISGAAYSLVMDIWTVLWYSGSPDIKLYLAAVVTALPHTALYCVSNVVFLWLFAKPFGEKLERVKLKYGV
jgi:energy-coupling factor transport system substrate-specific component